MMILIIGILSEEQRPLMEKIFRDHHVFFQLVSCRIVGSEETAKDAVSVAYLKIMDNIKIISELPCPQMTAFCVIVVKNASYELLRQSKKIVPIGWGEDSCKRKVAQHSRILVSQDFARERQHNAVGKLRVPLFLVFSMELRILFRSEYSGGT